ncbi:MAG: peptidoglycan-associated lipoprotein Pal [Proteobacteria bacterium]|nr:peptidoglycan-associated lipoprotein Pal [Pseudomonadota bacterium]
MNQTTTRFSLTAVLAAAVLAAGCASQVPLQEKPVVETRPTPGQTTPPPAQTSESKVATVDLNAQNEAAVRAAGSIVYFDYDSFIVKDDYRNIVQTHAKLMNDNRARRFMLEGHTDERGGREYNLALGQKRAEAVGQALTILGVQADQIEAVSYGKERPAVEGHTEDAWAKNRRVELRARQ